jgi:V/A-type H+-transporting ATPase subunit B
MPESVLFHTRTLSIIGDILRIQLPKSECDGPSFGDLAEVRDEHERPRIAQVVKLDGEVASLQVFSGTKGLTTRAQVRFLGHPPDVAFSSNILGRVLRGDGSPLDGGPSLDTDPRIRRQNGGGVRARADEPFL